MLRSIYQRLLGVFTTKSRRKTPRGARSRRLGIESLESRKLLTVTTLTYNSISDGSFEAPALPAKAYQVMSWLGNPAATSFTSPWQFTGIAGVSANNSAFTTGNPPAPSGNQVAFIQNLGSMSQSVYLQGGVYNLSALATQRIQYQSQAQSIEVLVDGAEVGVITPVNPVITYQRHR